jgi:hypothetical protein
MATGDILRVNYTEGQFLSAADFTAEQTYMDQSRRRHYISEHTWGIVPNLARDPIADPNHSGLTIAANPGNVWVVKAGMAIDAYGREIHLFQDEPLNTTEIAAQLAGQANATLEIWITYNTETTEPAANGYASCISGASNTRIRESFQLIYQDSPPPFDHLDPEDPTKWPVAWQDLPDDAVVQPWPLFLGKITWANGAITGVDPTGRSRHYSGLAGVEVYSQTDQFDVHAATLRIRVEGANDAIITAKSTAPTSDLHIRTNDTNGGNNVLIDKDNLKVDKKIVVKGTVGNGSGRLYVEAESSQDLAMLTRPANAGPGATHDLAIRTNDGNGGNHIVFDKDDVTVQSLAGQNLTAQTLTVTGGSVFKGGMELWGGQFLLKQSDGTDDTDPMAISRFNNAPDHNDFRIQIGDNLGGDDRFVVGPVYFGDGQFKEQFVVDNLGNVKTAGSLQTAGTVNGRDIAADGAKLDGLQTNNNQFAVISGQVFDGAFIPLPSGYTPAQCKWIVSPFVLGGRVAIPFLGDPGTGFVCWAGLNRQVTAQWFQLSGGVVSGFVNYLVVGIK